MDSNTVQRILSLAGFEPSDRVVEIGPGRGALTIPLAHRVREVIAVEKDEHLAKTLREALDRAGVHNVAVVAQDVLRWDFGSISPQSSPIHVIGNLPYNISSPFLEKLIHNRDRLGRAVLMFQREVADRLTASAGGKTYGALTVLIQYHARITRLLDVSRNVFYPRPKVDSALVELDFQKPYPRRALNESVFEAVVRGAFAHRRKTILNSLKIGRWGREELLSCMEACGVNPETRAERLGMEEFLCLGDSVALTNEMPVDK
jgi:16S rRNA (adenine1518-N6/adenine1519-N6)-dimethyltransferase